MSQILPAPIPLVHPDEVNDTPLPAPRWADALGRNDASIYPLQFSADWREYWRIWIVNLGLSILTLGIYSAWAKVRTRRYFYGHVALGDSSFEYHGRPLAILRGRLIAAALFIVWLVCTQIGTIWVSAALLAFLILLPWLIVKAATFRAHNSSWRGLRFGFSGRIRQATLCYTLPWIVVGGLVAISGWLPAEAKYTSSHPAIVIFGIALFAAYLCIPAIFTAQKRFLINHHHFGGERFSFSGSGATLLGIYFLVFLIMIPLQLLVRKTDGLVEWAALQVYPMLAQVLPISWLLSDIGQTFVVILLSPFILLAASPLMLGLGYLRGRSMVWQWENTRLGEHGFRCHLNPWLLGWFYFCNAVVIALSLGLLIPWAMTRTARLRARSLEMVCLGSLDDFVAQSTQGVGAIGDEVGDLIGLDVGI